jgi:hypothetical protein
MRVIVSLDSQLVETGPECDIEARSPSSSRPKRTRISCHAVLDKTACAPFRKEGRMKCNNATKLNRKSGGA